MFTIENSENVHNQKEENVLEYIISSFSMYALFFFQKWDHT